MPWGVKVVVRVQRSGQSATQLLDRLRTAEGVLSADITAVLLPLEPGATVAWWMRVAQVTPTEFEVYPKLVLTLPRWEATLRPVPAPVYVALRTCRDTLIARLTQLAAQFNWTVLSIHNKRYED